MSSVSKRDSADQPGTATALSTTAKTILTPLKGCDTIILMNDDTAIDIWVALSNAADVSVGGTAGTNTTTHKGIYLKAAGGGIILEGWEGYVQAIAASGTPNILITRF